MYLKINTTALPMATHQKIMGLTLDSKFTYSTHIHNISVQAHNPLQMIKALTSTGWGKQKETLIATYKAAMKRLWSMPLPYVILDILDQHKKLQVMQNAAIRNASGCTQDTHIQHMHDVTLILPIHEHLPLHTSQYKHKTQHPSHPLHKHTT